MIDFLNYQIYILDVCFCVKNLYLEKYSERAQTQNGPCFHERTLSNVSVYVTAAEHAYVEHRLHGYRITGLLEIIKKEKNNK